MDLLDAIVERDRDALAGMVSDDVVFHRPGSTYRGREQVVELPGIAPGVIPNLRAGRGALAITAVQAAVRPLARALAEAGESRP